MEQRISFALRELKRRGVTRVVFYGAGEIMEAAHRLAKAAGLEVERYLTQLVPGYPSRPLALSEEPVDIFARVAADQRPVQAQ